MYEDALAMKNTVLPEMDSNEHCRESFKKVLDMYRNGDLDGTSTTYICAGKVIQLDSIKNMPEYTIINQPGIEQYHFEWLTDPGAT